MFEHLPLEAGGDIRPSRFIKLSGTAYEALESGANERTVGVSGEGAHDAPIPNASANAGEDGDDFHYVPPGQLGLLEAGEGGWSAGDQLKSDADGKGVVIAESDVTQWVGAIAHEAASAGEKGKVLVVQAYPVTGQTTYSSGS